MNRKVINVKSGMAPLNILKKKNINQYYGSALTWHPGSGSGSALEMQILDKDPAVIG